MLFDHADEFVAADRHAVTVFGMAGVGKTRLSALLRRDGWFHYSADYRIGTRYMGEFIVDNFKREAMKVPFLRDLLISDSIYISSNITFHNLDPLSTYLGTPGDPDARWPALCRIPAAAGAAPRRRNRSHSGCALFHRAGPKRFTATPISSATPAAR